MVWGNRPLIIWGDKTVLLKVVMVSEDNIQMERGSKTLIVRGDNY